LVAVGIIVLLALAGGLSWQSLRGATAFQSSASSGFKRPSTRNIAAYELYERGNDPALFRSDSGVRVAASYLRQALALDPNYGDAYAGLARVHTRPGNAVDPALSRRERLALAEQEAMRAVSLDDSSAEAHSALGMVRRNIYEFESAEREYLRAIEIEPANPRHYEWLSALHVATGRSARGLMEAKRALQLDPLSPTAMAEVANSLLAQDRCDEALVLLEKLASLRPPLLRAGAITAQCYARKRMWPEALEAAQRNLTDGGPRARALIGYVLARSGRADEAGQLIASLLSSQGTTANSFDVAIVYSALGDSDNALKWLERAIDDRSLGFEWLPDILDGFRRHRHFSRYHQQLGLEFDRPGI
jgi:tetratricopeptide (TPR) repeat protein